MTQDPDVLHGLDEIDWASLTHAFGPAADVPDLLRALAEGDDSAISELFNTVWHQYSVYEATAYAVPFLWRLLDREQSAARPLIAGLLGAIADGEPHGTINDSEPEEAVRQELSWVRAAREAVWQGSAVALRLLASGDAAMRRAAMSILACFPQHAAQLVPRLRAALERRDASPHERALAGLALAALGTFEEQAFAVGPSAFVRQARDLARTAADGDTDAAATSLLVLTESIDRDAEDLSDWLDEGQ